MCGITSVKDAVFVGQAGVDAIGLVFYEPSPRCVTIEQARIIVRALPPFISKVALFVNATTQHINDVLRQISIDVLQFHGDESEQQCSEYGRAYIKAVRMHGETDLNKICEQYKEASALLLDNFKQDHYGATGQVFDWSLIPEKVGKPIVLAGGLTVDNIDSAIRATHPYAVDVNSGVECAAGRKDITKVNAFTSKVSMMV